VIFFNIIIVMELAMIKMAGHGERRESFET